MDAADTPVLNVGEQPTPVVPFAHFFIGLMNAKVASSQGAVVNW